MRNGIFAAISVKKKKKDVAVVSNCSHCEWWAGEPWGRSGRKEYLLSRNHQTAATPYGEPWGDSGCANTRFWPQIAEMHIKGMISVWAQTHWKRPWCWERLKAGREGGDRMRCLSGITDSMDEFEQILKDSEEQGSLVCCSPWGCKELDVT